MFIISSHFLQRQMASNVPNCESLSDGCKVQFDLLIGGYQNTSDLEKRVVKSYKNCQEQLKHKGKKVPYESRQLFGGFRINVHVGRIYGLCTFLV